MKNKSNAKNQEKLTLSDEVREARSNYVAELANYREQWVQAFWAHQTFHTSSLFTATGEKLKVIFPGWLNKGPGPDFLDARIRINNDEFFGAVEIHTKSSHWKQHKHQQNPVYNQVILHVVMNSDQDQAVLTKNGEAIAEFNMQPFLNQEVLTLIGNAQEMLQSYHNLPGRCGFAAANLAPRQLQDLIVHAAENRMSQKIQPYLAKISDKDAEELLFQALFRALGHSAYADVFQELAKLYPLHSLQPKMGQALRNSRVYVLSRWLGSSGLLKDTDKIISDATLRHEIAALRQEWEQVPKAKVLKLKAAKSSRPQNSPERRLVGMFHHLYRFAPEGLLKTWLGLLKQLEPYSQHKHLKKLALEKSLLLFHAPEWETWTKHFSRTSDKQNSGSQLIGKDRLIILWANAIIPFFLAYARFQKWLDLEKLLYRLYIVLPPEPANEITRFMELRLLPFAFEEMNPKSLRTQQGLIQIHQDFCRSFHEGCVQCRLLNLLEKK